MAQLIAFRALQGVRGSGVYPVPFTDLPEITPPKQFALLSGILASPLYTRQSYKFCYTQKTLCDMK